MPRPLPLRSHEHCGCVVDQDLVTVSPDFPQHLPGRLPKRLRVLGVLSQDGLELGMARFELLYEPRS